jgi:hypothetical protein
VARKKDARLFELRAGVARLGLQHLCNLPFRLPETAPLDQRADQAESRRFSRALPLSIRQLRSQLEIGKGGLRIVLQLQQRCKVKPPRAGRRKPKRARVTFPRLLREPCRMKGLAKFAPRLFGLLRLNDIFATLLNYG